MGQLVDDGEWITSYGGQIMNRKAAIDAKCKECIYDPVQARGSWRKQVAYCTSIDCPLYEVRPMPGVSTKLEVKTLRAREKGQFRGKI